MLSYKTRYRLTIYATLREYPSHAINKLDLYRVYTEIFNENQLGFQLDIKDELELLILRPVVIVRTMDVYLRFWLCSISSYTLFQIVRCRKSYTSCLSIYTRRESGGGGSYLT